MTQDIDVTMLQGATEASAPMASRSLTDSASDMFKVVDFQTNSLYNQPAPEPWVAFLIGGVFFLLAIVLWAQRVAALRKYLGEDKLSRGTVRFRSYLSAYIDSDTPLYTIAKMASQSFIFLGGLQMNYRLTFSIMLAFFALESSCDSLRILLSFREANSLDDVVVTSKEMRTELRRHPLTILQPNNVYEDLTRKSLIVGMVFVTQAILISFVVTDIFGSETHSCLDGSSGCPVTGTFGSWGFYVLGIFMACVVLLGPKTNFGMSEQNPAFWLQLLLSAKHSKNKCTWYDPVKDKNRSRLLESNDWRVWARFAMSFLINGVGFHILVHALPIQVAGQSSLTGVVFRAVGMLYLVDMDDTPGYAMTLVPNDETIQHKDSGVTATSNSLDEDNKGANESESRYESEATMGIGEMSIMAQRIIDDAEAKLKALSAGNMNRSATTEADDIESRENEGGSSLTLVSI